MRHSELTISGRSTDYTDTPVTNGEPFWPDLNLGEFQRLRKLPLDLPADTALNALLASIAEVNADLASVVSRHQSDGYATARDVPGASAGSETQLTAQYKKAVYARSKADLMGEFQTIARRDTMPGQEGQDTRDSLLAEAAQVIRNMKGYGRVGIYKV
ncbi:TPA: head completion/stabilization protein [Enterobacter kobei]|nr:head completion/stabilization protein [Enterobacter kobei]